MGVDALAAGDVVDPDAVPGPSECGRGRRNHEQRQQPDDHGRDDGGERDEHPAGGRADLRRLCAPRWSDAHRPTVFQPPVTAWRL